MERALAAFDDPELRMDMIERQMGRLDRGYADFLSGSVFRQKKSMLLNPDGGAKSDSNGDEHASLSRD